MKKILLILFCFVGLFVKAQMNTAWFNSYNSSEPIVETIRAIGSLASDNSAVIDCYGDIVSDMGSSIIEYGAVYSTINQNPTISDSKELGGDIAEDGTYRSVIFHLQNALTYYVRAYAINSIGVGYGATITVVTPSPGGGTPVDSPTVTTNSVTSITSTSANVNCSITDDGDQTITEYGIYYRRIDVGTYTKVSTSGSATNYTISLSGLSPSSTYYTYAFATNASGTGFGGTLGFTTSAGSGTSPTVTTNSITNITSSSAIGGGNVTNEGSSTVTHRGVQWSLTSDFATILGSTMDGAGTGSYSSNITGLTYSTQYHVRAYATNSAGTSYGSVVNFITSPCPLPSVETFSASNITSSSFILYSGNISLCGSQIITSHTIMFSTSSSFTVSQYSDIISSSTDDYSISYSNGGGLTILPNTTYYYRARIVVNSTIYYGNILSLTTLP